ncbi:parvulin-like peptidyl-prolyl cis-trans isomerase protein [Aneurinibacillus soli]|uniref:peptidylprolyl isomerase n=1 Tax=Aneurinibacillus soli TaxID=1500254 RepID=A0A0U4NGY6_9BACL|nr:peptidylprolyl isomerase [Aneurinibacillus soli]PYE64039.1 parvulin-like peptidyl-prolyl cis-trans isomerase protein [Aneurinibacillus soli]BAU27988.1 PPIC-type PPIASE domain protein [Aneurinibacillus soli]
MDAMELVTFSMNGTEWRLRDVLKLACMEGGFSAIEDSIRRAVTLEFAEQHNISIDEQEWKAKANEMRLQLGLYSVAETLAWLSMRGLATVDLFETAKARFLTEKVKRIVSEDRIDTYFLENRLSFDKANVSQLVIGSREQAQELLFQLEEGEPFYKLAQTYCLNSSSKYDGGYVGWVGRAELSGEEESFVFGSEAGQTVGPFPFGSFYRLLHIWEVIPAELTGEVRLKLADLLFEEWLNEAVKKARVDVRLWRYLAGEQLG